MMRGPEYFKKMKFIRIFYHSMIRLFILILLAFPVVSSSQAQTLAFPGAEGGGKFTTGGRGGKVLFVENLNDKGPGSFRRAIETEGPRTILFRISGNIELTKPIFIKNGDLTIAGQSAPGDGICLVNYGIEIEASNIIIRFIRVRPGDKSGEELDAISGIRNKNIIIDHCSFSWGTDEAASFYENTDFTLQWCIISESLDQSVHSKGNHGYGGIWGGNNATFHHNLITDHSSRNPRFHGSRYNNKPELEKVDFRNNVIYNWGNNSIYGGEEGHYNVVGNYFKPGPATDKDVKDRILDLTQSFFDPRYNKDTLKAGKFFLEGNVLEGSPEISRNNWGKGVQGSGVDANAKAFSMLIKPVITTKIKSEPAVKAYQRVLFLAGASLSRDAVDNRIVKEVTTGDEQFGAGFAGGGKGIIDSPADVGGWPVLKQLKRQDDRDNDGIPDAWEIANGLNPSDSADSKTFILDKNYTNLEIYLNLLVKDIIR